MAIDRTKKVSEFARISRAGTDDLLLLVNDPNGTPSTRTITIKNLYNDVGAEAVFYANTTFKANSHFQSNTLFTGNDNRFNSNVHFTSNLTISNTASIEAYGRTYSGSNPPIGNAEFQAFVANTNLFIQTLQDDGTFLLPNGAFAVANTTYQTDLANTNSRLLGLEAYGQLASNAHVIRTYVSNTTYQAELSNTNSSITEDRARLTTLETKVANQESLTANGFNVAFANAVSTASAQTAAYVTQYAVTMGDVDDPFYKSDLDGVEIYRTIQRFNEHFWEPLTEHPEQTARSANGSNVTLEDGLWMASPSPSLGFSVRANPANTALVLSGASTSGAENETIFAYAGFTYSFYPQWNDEGRNIIIVNTAGDANSVWANTKNISTVNTGFSYTDADPANTIVVTAKTMFTVPMNQVSTLYYQDSANSQMYGEIRIR